MKMLQNHLEAKKALRTLKRIFPKVSLDKILKMQAILNLRVQTEKQIFTKRVIINIP